MEELEDSDIPVFDSRRGSSETYRCFEEKFFATTIGLSNFYHAAAVLLWKTARCRTLKSVKKNSKKDERALTSKQVQLE